MAKIEFENPKKLIFGWFDPNMWRHIFWKSYDKIDILRFIWACSILSNFYLTARTLCSGVKGAFLREWIEGEVVRSTNRQLCIGEVSDIPSLQKWKWIQTHILGKCKICFAAECIFNWLHHKWGCRALLIFLPICQRGLSCHKRAIIIATTQKKWAR